ncbi:MAG: hypothetical protein NVSMB2_20550 [Chloroflexota bacterium]
MIASSVPSRFAPPGYSATSAVDRGASVEPILLFALECTIVHQTRGRVRLRVPCRKAQPGFFKALSESLARRRGIQSVRANPDCATLVIRFDPTHVSISDIQRWLRKVAPVEASALEIRAHTFDDLRQSITATEALEVLVSLARGDIGRAAASAALLLLTSYVRTKIHRGLRDTDRTSKTRRLQLVNGGEFAGGILCAA